MIVADIHEGLLDAMQTAGVAYLTQRQFSLADAENVQAFHEHSTDVTNCVWCNGTEAHEEDCDNPAVFLVDMTINGAIARLKGARLQEESDERQPPQAAAPQGQ